MAAQPPAWSSISRRVPGWVLSRPYAAVAALRCLNVCRRYRWLMAACVLTVGGALWAAARLGTALETAWAHWRLVAVVAFLWSYVGAHRRRLRIAAEDAQSWLSPVAVPRSHFLRMTFAPGLQLLAVALLLAADALARPGAGVAVRLLLLVTLCFGVGLLAGWLARQRLGGVPSSHYVKVRYPRARWATAPTLTPLSYWASGQASVFLKPKVIARAALPVLLAVPMGISANDALGTAALAIVVLSLMGHTVAALRVALAAGAWLSPTPVERRRFAVAVGSAALMAQALTCVVVLFLASAVAPAALIRRFSAIAAVFLAESAALILLAVGFAFKSAVVSRVRTQAWLR
jgi:hypothetical protein